MRHFAYLFIFCIDLLTSASNGHSGYARVIPLGRRPADDYSFVLLAG